MSKLKNMVGQVVHHLVIQSRADDYVSPSGSKSVCWNCLCDCGKETVVRGEHLRTDHTKSCGHCNDIQVGDRFGELEYLCHTNPVIDPRRGIYMSQGICLCDCGRYWKGRHNTLKTGKTESCGHCNDVYVGDIYGWAEVLCGTIPYTKSTTGYPRKQVICFCLLCGNYFVVREDQIKNNNTQSCGCYNRSQSSISHTGRNHHNWKGGITALTQSIRNSLKYKLWRTQVFKKDNYTCQYSRLRGGHLEVHHKKPFHVIVEENNITMMKQALDCEELWDVENGVTLLHEFHSNKSDSPLAFHRIYGNFTFSIYDFERWVNNVNSCL